MDPREAKSTQTSPIPLVWKKPWFLTTRFPRAEDLPLTEEHLSTELHMALLLSIVLVKVLLLH